MIRSYRKIQPSLRMTMISWAVCATSFAYLPIYAASSLAAIAGQPDEPEIKLDLGPWESDEMHHSLSLRLSQRRSQTKGLDRRFEVRLRPLDADATGARATILEADELEYIIDIPLDPEATPEASIRVLATILANSLDGIASGEIRPTASQAGASLAVLQDTKPLQSKPPQSKRSPSVTPTPVASRSHNGVVAQAQKKYDAPNSREGFGFQKPPLFAVSLGSAFVFSAANNLVPGGRTLASAELGLSARLFQWVESDLRLRIAQGRVDIFHEDVRRLRAQAGLGFALGWKRLRFPVSAAVDLEDGQMSGAIQHPSKANLGIESFLSTGVTVRSGFRYTWPQSGRRWRFSLGAELGLRYAQSRPDSMVETAEWNGSKYVPKNIAPVDRPRSSFNGWELETGLVLRWGRQ